MWCFVVKCFQTRQSRTLWRSAMWRNKWYIMNTISQTFLFMQAERQRQHRFERELQERDRRLKQQEKAFVRINGLQETLETHILALSTNRCHVCCVHLALQWSYQLPVTNFTSLHHILALAGYVHIILMHKKLLFAFFPPETPRRGVPAAGASPREEQRE